MSSICISASGSNSISRLELGKNLLHFIEFDFTYFWEQCMEFGRLAKKTGGFPHKQLSIVKSAIIKSHPFIELQINTAFDHVAMDCIIEYICHSEGISLEELWARCITPKSLYEKSIFNRISEYKTGRGINQWANIVRMQDYAKIKLAFIFDGSAETASIYRARKEYFDLTFSVIANELGYRNEDMPYTKCYSPSLLPDAPFMMSGLAKSIVYRMENVIDSTEPVSYRRTRDILRDQTALDAFSHIKQLSRPSDKEIRQVAEAFKAADCLIFQPVSLKAVIDLEFDKMIDSSQFAQKCSECGKYFLRSYEYTGTLCNRVNASGKSCRELARPPVEELIRNASPAAPKASDGIEAAPAVQTAQPEAEVGSSRAASGTISASIDRRCERVYAALSSKAGNNQLSVQEFEEWSAYLMNMKRNIELNELTITELQDFLDYTEQMYSLTE